MKKKVDYNKMQVFVCILINTCNRTLEQRNAASQLWEELEVVLVNLGSRQAQRHIQRALQTYAECNGTKTGGTRKTEDKANVRPFVVSHIGIKRMMHCCAA